MSSCGREDPKGHQLMKRHPILRVTFVTYKPCGSCIHYAERADFSSSGLHHCAIAPTPLIVAQLDSPIRCPGHEPKAVECE